MTKYILTHDNIIDEFFIVDTEQNISDEECSELPLYMVIATTALFHGYPIIEQSKDEIKAALNFNVEPFDNKDIEITGDLANGKIKIKL